MRLDAAGIAVDCAEFQSTHPVWDATGIPTDHQGHVYFNPRIPYGMRPVRRLLSDLPRNFNPRIPYGMRRLHTIRQNLKHLFQSTHPVWDATALPYCPSLVSIFQSTHPVWDATDQQEHTAAQQTISIHASRMGCDLAADWTRPAIRDFNPRIPYGMRLRHRRGHRRKEGISIHASRMGCDCENGHCIP